MSKINKTVIYLLVISLTFAAWFLTAQRSAYNQPNNSSNMKLISSAFKQEESIPDKYTCTGEDINPPLEFKEIPAEAEALALVIDDPDAPGGTWIHWTLWNINPEREKIEEDSVPQEAIGGMTDFGETGYGGPCPPSGEHRYRFKAYALDKKLNLKSGAEKEDLDKVIEEHIIEEDELMGVYSK